MVRVRSARARDASRTSSAARAAATRISAASSSAACAAGGWCGGSAAEGSGRLLRLALLELPVEVGCALGGRVELCDRLLALALGDLEQGLELVALGAGLGQLRLRRGRPVQDLGDPLRACCWTAVGRCGFVVFGSRWPGLDFGAQVVEALVDVGASLRGGGCEHLFDFAVDALGDRPVVGDDGVAVELLGFRLHGRSMNHQRPSGQCSWERRVRMPGERGRRSGHGRRARPGRAARRPPSPRPWCGGRLR